MTWCAPSSVMIGVQEKPGSEVSTIRMEIPLCRGASGAVRQASLGSRQGQVGDPTFRIIGLIAIRKMHDPLRPKRLLREPLHHVAPIVRLICKRLELATGIAATANIDKCKRVTMRCEVCGAGVIRVGDVGCKSKNNWSS